MNGLKGFFFFENKELFYRGKKVLCLKRVVFKWVKESWYVTLDSKIYRFVGHELL